MKKMYAVGIFIVGLMTMGAGCSAQTNVGVKSDMMKASSEGTMMDDTKAMKTNDAMKNDSEAMMKDEKAASAGVDVKMGAGVMMKKEPAMAAAGTYESYSANKLALAQSGKVILFFKASWCPTCKAVDADILGHLSAIPAGTHILIVDYDTSAELKKKYGVTYQHTFVQVDTQGALIKKWSGSPTLAALVKEIK